MFSQLVSRWKQKHPPITRKQAVLLSLAFNVYWYAAVGLNWTWPLLIPLFACWWWRPRVAQAALCWAPLGILVDLMLTFSNVHDFGETFFPPWLIVLWLGFVTFAALLKPLLMEIALKYFIAGFALGGVSSYWLGYRLGAVEWPMGLFFTLLLLMVIWLGIAILTAVFFRLETRVKVEEV